MIITQSGIFNRRTKKMHPNEKAALDKAIRRIIKQPDIGQMKIGDLAGVRVYKYKFKTQQYLLAYIINDEPSIKLLAIGVHENFYRDLRK